jgi:para-nitrobenzyl esterase
VHGNWGFLDQKAGIDWVRCNIVNFGGDPDNITIFGQSAGGRSVFVHMTSPMAAGSFQKAIAQSCGAMRVYAPKGLERPYQTLAQAEETGRAFFEFIGANSLNEARALSADTIFEKHLAFNKSHLSPMGNFGLIIDGKYVTEDPTDTFLAGNYPQIPLIMGLTADEFTAGPEFGDQASIKKWALDNFGDLADDFLALCREKAGDDPQKMKEAATIRLFDISVRQCLDLSAERGHRDIYYYLFGPEIPGDDAGAFHSSDLWFEFETLAKCWRPFTGKHYDLARQMCNYWTNFAKKGNPNGLDHDGTAMPEWTPYSLESPRAMAFMDSPSMQMENPDKLTDFLVRHNRALNQK